MRSISTLIIVIAAVVALIAAAAPDPKLVAKGRQVFETRACAGCHSIGGKGGTLAKPLDGVGDRRDGASLRKLLEDPPKAMPPDAKIKMPKYDFKPGEIDALVAYLSTLKGAKK